jgi:hypothetical protein
VGVEAHDLQEAWLDRALASAGIDRGSWRPGCGVEENRRTVEAVYAYYWRLFLDHPCLQWAGLAGMIGPAFYAGFTDLGFLPDAVRAATHRAMEASSMPPLNRRVERGAGTGAQSHAADCSSPGRGELTRNDARSRWGFMSAGDRPRIPTLLYVLQR